MRTLLLVFIHGFKGDDDTFGGFPKILQKSLPNTRFHVEIYPKYDTRGDLPACVVRFRNWLQEKVIDLEVENGTSSPMIDPSVRVVLLAHSMGGIVAADTLLSIIDDKPISSGSTVLDQRPTNETSKDPRLREQHQTQPNEDEAPFVFPYIAGIIAFDTPYLGLAPSMFANSADSNYKAASDAFAQVTGLASALGIFATTKTSTEPAKASSGKAAAALPAPSAPASSGWQWGKIAAYAGAASTVAAGATAAYLKRAEITEGFSWVTSHLEFVSVLMKINDLKARILRVTDSNTAKIANFYTILGKNATAATTTGGKLLSVGGEGVRTFCSLPAKMKSGKIMSNVDQRGTTDIDLGSVDVRQWWYPALNDDAKDEIHAHIGMFHPSTNTGYKELIDGTRLRILEWTGNWCEVDTT